MSLNLENKKAVVLKVQETLKGAQTIVIAKYQGITVEKMTRLRSNARKANVYLHVLKNTLARIAVLDTQFAPLKEQMVGPLVYAISEDPIAACKVINDFAKDNEAMKIVAGMYNDKLLDSAAVAQFAAIPSRPELLSMVMGVMQQVPASFVRCVAAIKDKKEQAA